MIITIDPGTKESAYMIFDYNHEVLKNPIRAMAIVPNRDIFRVIQSMSLPGNVLLIEDIESFGMPVGFSVFQTVRWTGRFDREWYRNTDSFAKYIRRSTIKLTLCGSKRAKDSNINAALKDIWGEKGTQKKPGLIHGISKDMWSALAIGTTYFIENYPEFEAHIHKLREEQGLD